MSRIGLSIEGVVLLLLVGVVSCNNVYHSSSSPPLILLDVDNTLYDETTAGIEAQIVQKTHLYCQECLGMSSVEADELYHKFGSTIEGLRQTKWKHDDESKVQSSLRDFYEYVYRDIDMTRLLGVQRSSTKGSSTGYTHSQQDSQLARRLLRGCHHPIAIASNSPRKHVMKVLKYLGLMHRLDNFVEILTPDRLANFPTKHDAAAFFAGSATLSRSDEDYQQILFLDDSQKNLDQVCSFLSTAIPVHVKSSSMLLGNALLRQLGLVDTDYEFDATKYLESKNMVDSQSIHSGIWNGNVIESLRTVLKGQKSLQIVDIGAGRLNILSLLLLGESSRGLMPLLREHDDASISYSAYESNKQLLASCQERLTFLGFQLIENVSDEEFVYSKDNWTVRLLLRDFDHDDDTAVSSAPDMIVGCCFADLMDPNYLVPFLLRTFRLLEGSKPTLLYFPITFAGTTQFLPTKPFETPKESSSTSRAIPSDTVAFQIYSKTLTETMGHNLDPFLLRTVFEDHGATLLAKGASDWKIDPMVSQYLYDTMLYFFGTTAGPPLLEAGSDAAGWINRARTSRPCIQVSNVDLLFRIGGQPWNVKKSDTSTNGRSTSTLREIQFTAPQSVTTVAKDIPKLGPDDVLIESCSSLISSGTELKVFKGLFEDAALDVNIKGMENERMAYPLAYGYCLVGRIVQCGSNVHKEKYFGRLAFTFAAHATHVVTPVEAIQLVPHGISPEDAIFMPSVETALSLVHDAHVRVGENVAVYGQGLIGLLVTAILHLNHHSSNRSGLYGTITTFDTIPDRLAASSQMGATQALLPGALSGPFDVTIEVSGNARALQSAIDSTADGGRVIVGSWYGNTDVSLKLGMDFHRSHKTIQTSQVSELPASVSGLWDKQRRFGLAWELVRDLRPSRLLTKSTSLDNAMEAYQALDKGTEIAIAFDYTGVTR